MSNPLLHCIEPMDVQVPSDSITEQFKGDDPSTPHILKFLADQKRKRQLFVEARKMTRNDDPNFK